MSAKPSSGAALHPVLHLLQLSTGYLRERGSPSPRLDAEVLLAHVLGMERIQLYVNFDRPVDREELDRYRELVRRRGRGEPVAYLVGEREFRSLSFAVSPAVLIPRPETELLVEAVLSELDSLPAGWVVDVGTGSGIIAVCLALEGGPRPVAAVDCSPAALEVARANARRHGVDERIRWLQGDLLAPLEVAGLEPVAAVVSNPPYVPTAQWRALEPTVRDYEPRLALDGGPDGLAVIRRLIGDSSRILAPGGLLALEVGAGQRAAVDGLLEAAGFVAPRWIHDYGGHARVVLSRRDPPRREQGGNPGGFRPAAAGGPENPGIRRGGS